MSPTINNSSTATKRAADSALNDTLNGSSKSATGAIRRTRNKQNKPPSASGRSHEENQERAYIAASRRSDRSIEARLESARRASEIHKKRCGRGLKVTEEAVMNEEMYEEEDPDYELRVNRLRMLMNYPNVGYHPYQWNVPQYRNSIADGSSDSPTTPGINSFQPNQLMQPMGSPSAAFMFQNPFGMAPQSTMNHNQMSPLSPGGHNFMGRLGPLTPSLQSIQTPSLPSTPAPHFLPPTQFSPKAERQEHTITLAQAKPEEPFQIEIPEHEVVLDQAPLDVSLNFEGFNDLRGWDNTEAFNMEEWVAQGP